MSGDRGFDVLISGGRVVDGTGNPPLAASVGVKDGLITILRGDVSGIPAADRIDATGRIVAPGFIDAHSHSDLVLFDEPQLESKLRQGVTTEVIGVDGLSYAPYTDIEDRDAFMVQNSGIAGLSTQLPPWRSIGEQLAAYDGRTALNVATFVGNTPLRVNEIGWDDIPATEKNVGRMKGMLGDAMNDGALGLSSGLDYPPGSYAGFDELVELAREAARWGGVYHTHVRYSLGDRFLDPFKEAIEISKRSGIPLQLTHFSRSARQEQAGGAQRLLDLLDAANADGVPISFDTYPYEWGGTRLARLLPAWIQAGHPSKLAERLAMKSLRDRLYADIAESPAVAAYRMSRPFSDLRMGNLTHEDHRQFEGRYLSEVVAEFSAPLPEVLVQLVSANPAATFTRPSPHAMTLWKFVCHPLGMIASDSVFIGTAASPRAFGCFVRILGDFVREERLLTIQEAVRKMTSFPAQRLGLSGRGVLVDGAHADIVVFDPKTVGAAASYEQPRELAVGVGDVLVNGVAAIRGGELTGALPGRALRRSGTH